MSHEFDKAYWEQHWRGRDAGPGAMGDSPPHPYLATEIADLTPGTALDAGCGAGAEAIWLAEAGWQVVAADISSVALATAAQRATSSGAVDSLQWIEADLSTWRPDSQFDLVTTHYAHPAMPQLDFYDRISDWVAPGGTLLIVGHLHTHDRRTNTHGHVHGQGHEPAHSHDDEHEPPAEASATPSTITGRLDSSRWRIVTADEHHRSVTGREQPLHDVVVRATRYR